MEKLMIGNFDILAGDKRKIYLPVAKLYTDADVSLPLHIIRTKKVASSIANGRQWMRANASGIVHNIPLVQEGEQCFN